MDSKVIVVTGENIAGRTIQSHLGIVTGSTVRARNFGSDIIASLKNVIGGELHS